MPLELRCKSITLRSLKNSPSNPPNMTRQLLMNMHECLRLGFGIGWPISTLDHFIWSMSKQCISFTSWSFLPPNTKSLVSFITAAACPQRVLGMFSATPTRVHMTWLDEVELGFSTNWLRSKILSSFICMYSEWQPPKVMTFVFYIVLAVWNLLCVKQSWPCISGLYHFSDSRSRAHKSLRSELQDSPPTMTMNLSTSVEAW